MQNSVLFCRHSVTRVGVCLCMQIRQEKKRKIPQEWDFQEGLCVKKRRLAAALLKAKIKAKVALQRRNVTSDETEWRKGYCKRVTEREGKVKRASNTKSFAIPCGPCLDTLLMIFGHELLIEAYLKLAALWAESNKIALDGKGLRRDRMMAVGSLEILGEEDDRKLIHPSQSFEISGEVKPQGV
ncbi:hypothetical protein OUZ56_031615 [Daphnia magna]|uniref:Uncharacterized protein n=1 Tax=Daphnia magna TaxID=35525 RepID=A0ABQ9ZUQ0_9CRUS|nr:hypothetical protein OUZ56_031615 [Daphnia magna]